MEKLSIDATLNNLDVVQEFIEKELENFQIPMKTILQISLSVEEVYVNIANYAYSPKIGKAYITCSCEKDPLPSVTITFADEGVPFNPLINAEPKVNLPASEREIGGLGILIVKKTMDQVTYKYENNMNVLTICKNISS